MKVLITGAAGLLGSEFVRAYHARGDVVVACDRARLDVTDAERVGDLMREETPDVVLHCAAYTAVDRAERDGERAFSVNEDGTRNVADAAASIGARFVYFSTDYVFDGQTDEPYTPDSLPNPLSVYGRSKVAGEGATQASGADWLIVRTGWLFGRGGSNFVSTVLRRAREGLPTRVVDDQRGRPTWATNLAEHTIELVDLGTLGIVHVANSGTATWFELAEAALRIQKLKLDVTPVSTQVWGAAAERPRYSVLDIAASEARLGRVMTPWHDALSTFLSKVDL